MQTPELKGESTTFISEVDEESTTFISEVDKDPGWPIQTFRAQAQVMNDGQGVW